MKLSLRQVGSPAIKLKYAPGTTGPAGPTGPTGPAGPANTLAIGTVTALSYGAPATATITGTAPSQTLNLGLPAGAQGPSGSVTDGDKGDIVVSSAGTVWTIENDAVTAAKISDVELKAIGGLTSAADKIPYFTGSGTAALADFPSAARTFAAATTAAAERAVLGVSLPSLFYAAGGTEASLGTAAEFRLNLDFTPTAPNVFLQCSLCFDAVSGDAGIYGYALMELYRVDSGVLFSTSGEVTTTLQTTGGYTQLSLTHHFAGLSVGSAYRAWLKPRVSATGSGIEPRLMRITCVNL